MSGHDALQPYSCKSAMAGKNDVTISSILHPLSPSQANIDVKHDHLVVVDLTGKTECPESDGSVKKRRP